MDNQEQEENQVDTKNEEISTEPTNKKPAGSTGPLIGTIIIILVIIIGAFYFLDSVIGKAKESEAPTHNDEAMMESKEDSSSDEVSDIEKYLENTDFDAMDKELNDIDAEFNAEAEAQSN